MDGWMGTDQAETGVVGLSEDGMLRFENQLRQENLILAFVDLHVRLVLGGQSLSLSSLSFSFSDPYQKATHLVGLAYLDVMEEV